MLLDNYPEETERLKKHERFFEWVTWFILIVSYSFSFLPLGLPIYRTGMNVVFAVVAITTLLTYRFFPFEKRVGLFKYSYKQKGFLIQLSDHIFASIVILFSGGIHSPFWFIYLLALIAGAMYLPAWAMVVAGIEAISTYLFTVAFLTPSIFHSYPIGFTSQMLIVPLASVFAVIMTYVVAKDLNEEIKKSVNLTRSLEQKAKEAMNERDKLNTIVKSVSDGIIVLDLNRQITFANRAAYKILRVRSETLLSRRLSEIFTITNQKGENVTDEMLCPLKEISDDELIFGPAELTLSNSENKKLELLLASTQIKDGISANIGSICIFRDIAKEKELEQMKLDFVAIAAHELRTPITGIRGYLSILIEEVSKKLTKTEFEMLQKAFISTTNLAALVENLLSISNIERHSLKLNKQPVLWSDLINEVKGNFLSSAEQKQIKIVTNVPKDLPKISIDRFRISEVISNLLANAITFSPSKTTITISASIDGKNLITHIQDQGEGIPETALPNLFTKFFRVSGGLIQGSKGTGLGLYISKSIVEMHQGKIWVESVVGKGSTFSFSLPYNTIS